MKYLYILAIFVAAFMLNGCEDKITYEYMANSPIYMSYDELRSSIEQMEAQEMTSHGKIYFKDHYIFVINNMTGIHVIDNSDVENPVNLTFLKIPGVVDMVVKDHILFADSYVDMVAFDLTDINNISEVNREKEVLPYTLPPYDYNYPIGPISPDSGVVVGWELKMVKDVRNHGVYPVYYWGRDYEGSVSADISSNSNGGVTSQGVSVGGSMTRFGILEETLYAVDLDQLHIFDISKVEEPEYKTSCYVGWNVETMFIYDEKAFFGTQNGMTIYSLVNRTSPYYISEFWHISSCDPVVVKDDLAYITLRGGNECGSNVNHLEVIDISNLEEPDLVAAYEMEEPYGLGISDNTLFVCDGNAGLKVYDVNDPEAIDDNQIAHFEDINAYDVIPLGEVLILIGEEGLYQYNYTNLEDIQLLSAISIGQ